MQKEKQLNPDQAFTHISLAREIRESANQNTALEPAAYRLIRRRARVLWPVKNEILSSLKRALEKGLYTAEEVKKIVVAYFGRKDEDVKKMLAELDLIVIKMNTNRDLELEKQLQSYRRSIVDGQIVVDANMLQNPHVLEFEEGELFDEESFWFQALAGIQEAGVLQAVREIRVTADILEAAVEQCLEEIVELNGKIGRLKTQARRGKGVEVIQAADEIVELSHQRDQARSGLQKLKEELYQLNHAWLLSKEQQLEHEAEVVINAMERIVARTSEIRELLANPAQPIDVASLDIDDLNLQAEAHLNVAARIRERTERPGLKKHEREFMLILADQLEETALVWEV